MKKLHLMFILSTAIIASLVFTGFSFANTKAASTSTSVNTSVSTKYTATAHKANTASTLTLQSKKNASASADELVLSFLGDSITAGYKTDKAYEYFLGELADADVVNNYGVSSTQVSDSGTNWKSEQSFVYRYDAIDEDSDVIFAWGGSNDWSHCAILGELGDTEVTTFYGALDTLFSSLTEEYPDATIITATPLRRVDTGWEGFTLVNENGTYEYTNANGDTLEDFANAVKEVAAKYNITVVDIYNAEECDFTSDTDYTTYWVDGLHPNAYADEIVANYIYSIVGDLLQ